MLTPATLALTCLAWELLFQTLHFLLKHLMETRFAKHYIPKQETRTLLKDQAPSYLLSTIHAVYVTRRGVSHLTTLFRAPIPLKLHNPLIAPDQPYIAKPHETRFIAEVQAVTQTNLILAGYLLCDLYHIILAYPTLGAIDTVLHHVIFLYCAGIAGHFHLFPFMFGWLIIGEASTPFLNMRWFLIKSGYGDGMLLTIVQGLFALTFFATRFALYSTGLFYQLELMPRVPTYLPKWAIYSSITFVVMGFLLNFVWLNKIVRIAFGWNRPKQTSEQSTRSKTTAPTTAHIEPEPQSVKQD